MLKWRQGNSNPPAQDSEPVIDLTCSTTSDDWIEACRLVIKDAHSTTWGTTFWTIDPRQLTEAATWLFQQVHSVNERMNHYAST